MVYGQNTAANSTGTVTQLHLRHDVAADASAIVQHVEHLIAVRSSRGHFFPAKLFADPAWDILLVLTLNEARSYRMTVSHLCDSVDAPATTALRWINTLTKAGLLVRREDTTDKRRKYIELSDTAYAKMVEYCSSFNAPVQLAA